MKYTVKSPILHNGKHYNAGETINLSDQQAEKLSHCLEPLERKINLSNLALQVTGEENDRTE